MVNLSRYRITYTQGGKTYRYYIAARNVIDAEATFAFDTQDEPRPQITEIVIYGEL